MNPAYVLSAVAALTASATLAHAQLRITEAMSNSVALGNDWFEVTNIGSTTVNVGGYRMDDSSFSFGASVALNGVSSIAPGESVLFIESAAGAQIPDLRTLWGQIGSVQIGFYSGSGVGLSSSGDGVVLFDSAGAEITRVTFGAATQGFSFGYNPLTDTFGGNSVVGQFGARLADNPNNLPTPQTGSPGVIPAPGAAALLAGAALLGARRRR